MSSRKKKPTKQPESAPPENRFNFAIGLVAGIAVVAVLAFVFRPKSSEPVTPAPVPQQAAPAAQSGPTPGQLPQFDEAQVADMPRIGVPEAKELLDQGTAVVIDVRDVDSYAAGHIPGSLQIPLEYVQGEIPWFPADKTLITVCT